jgi:hypothetical protein
MKKIYVSGYMNHEELNATIKQYESAHTFLESQGLTPVSVIDKPLWDANNSKEEAKIRIALLLECEELFLLPNWQTDRIAQLEVATAIALNIPVIPSKDAILPRQVVFYPN